ENDDGVNFYIAGTATAKWNENVLHRCNGGTDGAKPDAGLIFDAAGNLYGTTAGGGNLASCFNGCGVVFELTRSSTGKWSEHVLRRFNGGTDGAKPDAGLIFDAAGNLYGTTSGGGRLASWVNGERVVCERRRRST